MLEILGGESEKKEEAKGEKNGAVNWKIKTWGNAFQFYVEGHPETEMFLEFDELKAAGKAYELKKPLNILDVLERLEQLAPGLEKIEAGGAVLIRKHFRDHSGIFVKGRDDGLFMKDDTLKTINFLDFHDEILNNTPKLLPEEHE